LWRALARRCVGPYVEHAAAPLTLAGWVHWSLGQEPQARVALRMALRVDPDYTFAQLLHQACNEGVDPETIRTCLRRLPAGNGVEFPWEGGSEALTAEQTGGGPAQASRNEPAPGSSAEPAAASRTPASRTRKRPPAPKGSRRPKGEHGGKGARSSKGTGTRASSGERGRGAAGGGH
ncbi:DUF4192 domain-containing protein, partial [Streptomyces sp. T-3]|nr:DUF4192 domain-containing protein [Streptomyces sp. T-3]